MLLLSQYWFDLKLTSSLSYIYVVTLRVCLLAQLSRKGEAFANTVIILDDDTEITPSQFFLFILMFLVSVLSDPTAITSSTPQTPEFDQPRGKPRGVTVIGFRHANMRK